METQHLGKQEKRRGLPGTAAPQASTCSPRALSLTRSDLLMQGREEGQRPVILTANPEAIMLQEGAGSGSEPAHQGQQGCFTADHFKRKKLLLNVKVPWLGTQATGVEVKLGEASRYSESFPWGGPSQKFSLNTAPGCAIREKNSQEGLLAVWRLFFHVATSPASTSENSVVSLHLRNNKECVGKSGMLPWLGGTFHSKCSLKHWLFNLGKGCQVAEPASCSHSQHVQVLSGSSFFKLPLSSLVFYSARTFH